MNVMILGGAASGKSQIAEELLSGFSGQAYYVATMEPFGQEAQERIKRHRAMRQEKGFETLEQYVDLPALKLPPGCGVLVEDLTNLVANELFRSDGTGAERVVAGIERLYRLAQNVVVVTGDLFSGGRDYASDTLRYLGDLAWVNRMVAAQSDVVIEVVCGQKNYLKGAGL